MTRIICGVDVASQSLDARVGHTGTLGARFENTAAGIGELAAFCRRHRVELVVMEATGGYERLAFALLWGAGIPAAIVNPRSVRRFAEGMGILEKTDRIDAGAIAWYAEVKAIIAHTPPSETQARLAALVIRLRQLVATRVVHANQRLVRRYDPDFRAFHQRLKAAGKPAKVVRTALAHKLLVRLNAKARDVRQQFAQPA